MDGISWQDINVIISVATVAICTAVGIQAWSKREVQGAAWFTALAITIAWIGICYTLEAAAGNDLAVYISFSKLEYIGMAFIPLLWMGFALTFSGKERPLSALSLALLSAIPVITIALVFTNEFHRLIWEEPRFTIVTNQPIFSPIYGAWFWVYVLYSYFIYMAGSIILVRRAMGVWRLYRDQALLVFIGTSLPWISNLLDIFDDLNPVPQLYLNALFFTTCAVCFAFAMFRLRLLDIMPMAYDTILNNVPDGLIVVDMQDRIVTLNNYIKPFIDNPGQDVIGKPLSSVFTRYAGQFDSLRDYMLFNGTFDVNGVTIEVRISPVYDRSDRQRGRLFVISDVTARAKMEKAEHSEKLFAETMREIGSTLNSTLDTNRVMTLILESMGQLIAHSHANIMIIEEDGHTMRVRQHRGYSEETVAYVEATHLDYRTSPIFTRCAANAEPIIVPDTHADPEWQVVKGLESILSFACTPIFVSGKLVGFINIDGTSTHALQPDMANRLQVFAQQAALAIKNARMVDALAEHTVQVETLYERVSRLERLKSDMIRLAAHDLKNPLSVLVGYLSLFIKNPQYSIKTTEAYPAMMKATDRMLQIIDDFLSLERIAQVAEENTLKPFDLCEIVVKAEEEFTDRVEAKEQLFNVLIPDDTCIVNGDAVQLYEAVANFITNAIKYTPEGGTINLSLSCVNNMARVEVSDTGYGIPEDQQGQIFEPFYRVKTIETLYIEGTGLGLNLTKNIIERQGGTIIFHSVYGQGSTFGFEMPLHQSPTNVAEAHGPVALFDEM